MAYTTFNRTNNDQMKEPMFFGTSVNVSRYDQQKYVIFEKLIEKQLSFFWRPEEVDVSKDRIDFQGLPEHEKHIFISNLKYQTLLDSVQGRSPNVALLPMLAGVSNAQARQRALELLGALDVAHRAKAEPSQLSGGEQQRVSIARALANRPPVILADEPTAPLDSERALGVMRLLNQMARQYQTAIIVVTHDEKIIPTFKRIYHIRDGQTVEEAGEGRALEDTAPVPFP